MATVEILNRYNHLEPKEEIPDAPQYLSWLHLRYAADTSLQTMRQELASLGRNEKEIDLILSYIGTYVRDEMGITTTNSRSAELEAVMNRCRGFWTLATKDLDNAYKLLNNTSFASEVDDSYSYVADSDSLAALAIALLSPVDGKVVVTQVSGGGDGIALDVATKLVVECRNRANELSVAYGILVQKLAQFRTDLDAQGLTAFDATTELKALCHWMV